MARRVPEGATHGAHIQVHMVSLGCPKNLVDSEMILGNAGEAGLAVTASPEDADVIVVNTCGFIDKAKEESINAVLEACELKKRSRRAKKVVVTGCLAQRYGKELRAEIPEVDAIIGLGEYEDIGAVIRALAEERRAGRPILRLGDPDKACNAEVGRFRLTPRHYAYVKISEGCDNPCTFCAIPAMRGRFRSKPLAMIEAEARELVASGAREIVLISQDTTSYGVDLGGKFELPRLLAALARVDGLEWIRILYVYPAFLTDEMLDAIASVDKVVKYIDIPLQHIDDRMLRHMGRRMNEAKTRDLLERARRRIPGLYLRTTFIVGFPGEGEEEFRTLCDFVREFRFERLGVFPFSAEEGTPAARFADPVAESVSAARLEELMLIQQDVAFSHNRARRGEVVKGLVDAVEVLKNGNIRLRARSAGEAPEIDPSIVADWTSPSDAARAHRAGFREISLLAHGKSGSTAVDRPATGDFLMLEITGSREYDLIARPATPRTEAREGGAGGSIRPSPSRTGGSRAAR